MAKKKKAASKAKTKVKEMNQTHGMVEEEAEKEFQPSTLDQVWGDTGSGRYKTLDFRVYQKKLDDMSKSDLQAHATSLGLIPIDNSRMLRQRLEREFKTHISKYQKPAETKGEMEPISEEVRKILSEGR